MSCLLNVYISLELFPFLFNKVNIQPYFYFPGYFNEVVVQRLLHQ